MSKVKLKCRDCGEEFIVDDDKPLREQVDILHVWNSIADEEETGCQLRHREEDELLKD